MPDLRLASIALALAEGDPYARWYKEALDHAGVVYEALSPSRLDGLGRFSTLLLCGYGRLDANGKDAVSRMLDLGGSVVCSGGTWDVGPDLLGVSDAGHGRYSRATLLGPLEATRYWPIGAERAVFVGGVRVKEAGGQVLLRTSDGDPALVKRQRAFHFAPHLGQSMALILMGHSVENDGIGPGDGTAYLEDGVLRAEDGANLSFADDRAVVTGGAFFAWPHVDTLRDVWVRTILAAVEETRRRALIFWHWPYHADATAAFSVECGALDPERTVQLHNRLSMYGMPAAWLVPSPGFAGEVYRAMRRWEEEPGLLLHQDDPCSEEQMKVQHLTLGRAASKPHMTCVRPDDGRWHGLDRFYEAAEAAGARMSLSKGGRQPGTSGFLFGSCHPFFPWLSADRQSAVAELPYAMFQPGLVTPRSAYVPLIEQVKAHGGCLHVAVDDRYLSPCDGAVRLQELLMAIRQARLSHVAPDVAYAYERARRKMRLRVGPGTLTLVADADVEGMSLLVTGEPVSARAAGRRLASPQVLRYGAPMTAFTFDLEQKAQLEILFEQPALMAG